MSCFYLEFVDSIELVDRIIGYPELLEALTNTVKIFELFDVVTTKRENLQTLCNDMCRVRIWYIKYSSKVGRWERRESTTTVMSRCRRIPV